MRPGSSAARAAILVLGGLHAPEEVLMRMTVHLFRTLEGRLEGTVATAPGVTLPFASTLDLLRVLEGLDLGPPRPLADPDAPLPSATEDGGAR